jgi:hypothetical protein
LQEKRSLVARATIGVSASFSLVQTFTCLILKVLSEKQKILEIWLTHFFCLVIEVQMHPKLRFFCWILHSNRLNTRNMNRKRHYNIGNVFDCLLCANPLDETLEQLFSIAPLAYHAEIWLALSVRTRVANWKWLSSPMVFGGNLCSHSFSLWSPRAYVKGHGAPMCGFGNWW